MAFVDSLPAIEEIPQTQSPALKDPTYYHQESPYLATHLKKLRYFENCCAESAKRHPGNPEKNDHARKMKLQLFVWPAHCHPDVNEAQNHDPVSPG